MPSERFIALDCIVSYIVVDLFSDGRKAAASFIWRRNFVKDISIGTGVSLLPGLNYTPTGKGLGLDSSGLAPPVRQRSKRPCRRLIRPVYQ